MRVLVTGFEPFGGDDVNPSAMLAEALAAARIEGATVAADIMPCAFAPLGAALERALARHDPDLVVAFGLATGRAAISLERVAINLIDARIPDTEGSQPIDLPVVPGGPDAYFTTLPIKAAFEALRAAGIPAEVSQTAGTYACNALFYRLRHAIEMQGLHCRAGFVHLPCLPEMPAARDGAPSMPWDTMRAAGGRILEACLSRHSDLRIGAGAIA